MQKAMRRNDEGEECHLRSKFDHIDDQVFIGSSQGSLDYIIPQPLLRIDLQVDIWKSRSARRILATFPFLQMQFDQLYIIKKSPLQSSPSVFLRTISQRLYSEFIWRFGSLLSTMSAALSTLGSIPAFQYWDQWVVVLWYFA